MMDDEPSKVGSDLSQRKDFKRRPMSSLDLHRQEVNDIRYLLFR